MSNIVEQLSENERAREAELIAQINEGRGYGKRAWDLITPAITEVYEKKLYRAEGTIEEWAERNFGFTTRTLDYYLINGRVAKKIKAVDPEFDDQEFPVTYSNEINRYEEEDQAELWLATKDRVESGEKLTGRLIKEVARNLERTGAIHLRDGMSVSKSADSARIVNTIQRTWFEIEEADRAAVFSYILKNEHPDFLRAAYSMLEDKINELNQQQHVNS